MIGSPVLMQDEGVDIAPLTAAADEHLWQVSHPLLETRDTINNATLNTVFGYTSTTGESYVLISNDGVDTSSAFAVRAAAGDPVPAGCREG